MAVNFQESAMFSRIFLAALPAAMVSLAAQEAPAPKRPWSDKAALSYVAVGGNASSQSLGFSNEFKYTWADAVFAFNVGGVRVATTAIDRSAQGSSLATATVLETRTTKTSTETYFANLRYDHNITERLLWFGSAGWERNIPAGLDARYAGLAGLGYWWIKEDRTKFFTDAGVGYTKETLVFTPAGTDAGFATFHLGAKFEKKVFAASVFTSELNVSDSFKDTQNYLAVWRNGFTTTLSARLALKVGYDVTYKNKPASVGVDVVQTPVATPPVILGQVPFQLKKTDTVFTTSLVISF
jgi:putative salt-induced outer membrane protein YdiY